MKKYAIATMFVVLFSAVTGYGITSLMSQGVQYSNPTWAPSYYHGVRYYYIPDIETYYDLSNQDFVYLDNGQWFFSNTLPPIYSGYDLYNGFIIALDLGVYQPWMHHHFYVSNYPRFYYRSVYHDAEIANMRGFNENERKPFYWRQDDRNRMNELRKKDNNEKKHENTRPPQNANYYGKNIGQPVKVQRQMRENKQENQGHGRR